MALTAREWLILPEKEQKERVHELSPQECFLLRTSYACIHYAEEELRRMEEFRKAQTEVEKQTEKKAVMQKMFKVV